MTNSELIGKLNNLKSVNPDKNWLASNRELLLSQVSNSGAEKLSAWQVILINTASVLKSAAQPAYALGAFVLMLLTGSLFSTQLLAGTKPNDSLYIARIISERVKLSTTFNSEARNRMEVKFASSHAQDISVILSDPSFNNEANQDQVAKLNDSFISEVNTVKNSISRLSMVIAPSSKPDEVVMADSSKDDQGIQLSDGQDGAPLTTGINVSAVPVISATATIAISEGADLKATSAEEVKVPAENKMTTDADKILNEAQQLFESKDYLKASDKLKEVSASLE